MDKRKQFSQASNYALFYGRGKASELVQYEVVVLEPSGQSSDSLREIQRSGTLAIAYLSVVEVPVWSKVFSQLKSTDFLQVNVRPYINSEYGNYWVDLASRHWQDLLLQNVSELLDRGYDGIFLDTIGYVESVSLSPLMRAIQLQAAHQIVQRIRTCFPKHILIQNCGLEELYLLNARYIDGICWENPPLNRSESEDWANIVLGNLERVKESYGLQILLLVEENNLCAQEFHLIQEIAQRKKFLLYYAPSFYTTGVSKKN